MRIKGEDQKKVLAFFCCQWQEFHFALLLHKIPFSSNPLLQRITERKMVKW